MLDKERKLQVLDISVVIVVFIVACIASKYITTHVSDTWLRFNGPAIGILAVGELIWWRIRKRLIRKWEDEKT